MKSPALRIRMGAAHWDVTVYTTGQEPTVFDMRRMTKENRRQFIFQVVKACREAGRVVT